MHDFKHNLKGHKPPKVKLNKRKQEKQPRDWRKLFHRLLRISLFAGSATLAVAGALLGIQFLRESDYFTVRNVRVIAQSRRPRFSARGCRRASCSSGSAT